MRFRTVPSASLAHEALPGTVGYTFQAARRRSTTPKDGDWRGSGDADADGTWRNRRLPAVRDGSAGSRLRGIILTPAGRAFVSKYTICRAAFLNVDLSEARAAIKPSHKRVVIIKFDTTPQNATLMRVRTDGATDTVLLDLLLLPHIWIEHSPNFMSPAPKAASRAPCNLQSLCGSCSRRGVGWPAGPGLRRREAASNNLCL